MRSNRTFFGITSSNSIPVDKDLCESDQTWGFLPGIGICHNGKIQSFASKFPLQKGDIVRVIFDRTQGKLSFQLNDFDLGPAFSEKPLSAGKFFPVVSLFENSDQITVL